jgi:hypothetical protein
MHVCQKQWGTARCNAQLKSSCYKNAELSSTDGGWSGLQLSVHARISPAGVWMNKRLNVWRAIIQPYLRPTCRRARQSLTSAGSRLPPAATRCRCFARPIAVSSVESSGWIDGDASGQRIYGRILDLLRFLDHPAAVFSSVDGCSRLVLPSRRSLAFCEMICSSSCACQFDLSTETPIVADLDTAAQTS